VSIVVFESSDSQRLAPITTGRLAAAITCGSYRLVDLVDELDVETYYVARPYLSEIQRRDFPTLRELDAGTADSPTLMLNALIVPSRANANVLRQLVREPGLETKVIWDRGTVAAIIRPPFSHHDLIASGYGGLDGLLADCLEMPKSDLELETFQQPHEVIAQNMTIIGDSLEHRISSGELTQLSDGVFVAENVSIGEHVLFETNDGPIIIDHDAKVGPYTLLRGPIYMGPRCRVLEHSAIKDMVSLGHTTKIGGEVEAAIVEPFSNKQHHGFLGHSYLGSWINLGAGTCNSDLKNTYGTVNMEYGTEKVATGMQFLGCVMGDYAKSAINTGIFTGKVIGVCSMMYGFVTSNVPSFVNYARLFGQLATLPPEVMVATQQRMFARRKVEQRECDVRLMHDMYRLTQSERDQFGDVLSL
jgi:glucose-1-phosphate thymidylyltransferase